MATTSALLNPPPPVASKRPTILCFSSRRPTILQCVPSTETPIVVEEDSDTNFRGCKACRREEIENGCNGEGRIQGGIATVPGFGWWPIKAYRPCPAFVTSGGRYRRTGQSMDQVVSGGASTK